MNSQIIILTTWGEVKKEYKYLRNMKHVYKIDIELHVKLMFQLKSKICNRHDVSPCFISPPPQKKTQIVCMQWHLTGFIIKVVMNCILLFFYNVF